MRLLRFGNNKIDKIRPLLAKAYHAAARQKLGGTLVFIGAAYQVLSGNLAREWDERVDSRSGQRAPRGLAWVWKGAAHDRLDLAIAGAVAGLRDLRSRPGEPAARRPLPGRPLAQWRA